MNYDRIIWKIMHADSGQSEANLIASLNAMDANSFLTYLHQHKIAGIIANQLRVLGMFELISDDLVLPLKKYQRAVALYNQLARNELIYFANLVKSPVYLVKGIAYECAGLYPDGVRAVGDLDVVMSYPACVKAWDKAIESGKYCPEEDFQSAIHKQILNRFPSYEHHHLPALSSTEIKMLSIEIHPQIFNPSMGVNPDLEYLFYIYSTEALVLSRPVPNVPGCFQFPDEYHFLFICMHVMDNWHKGEVSWRMLCDVQRFLQTHPNFDWDSCMLIVHKLNLYTVLTQCLGMVGAYLKIQVPAVLSLQSEVFPKEMQALNQMGAEYAQKVSLRKRVFFYVRHMSKVETVVYLFRTLFPKRAYLKVKYARMYKNRGYFGVLFYHLSYKLRFYFHKTVL